MTNVREFAAGHVNNPEQFNGGLDAGDVVSMVAGVMEASGGQGASAAGVALAPLTEGASLAVAGAGQLAAAHGAAVAGTASLNFASQKGRIQTSPNVTEPYKRPPNATNKQQRESVQGKACSDCGSTGGKNVADHKTPLVKEYYETGTINKQNMRDVNSVQPQCTTCSAKQGAELSRWSKEVKKTTWVLANERAETNMRKIQCVYCRVAFSLKGGYKQKCKGGYSSD
jgi:hypothetical protein